MIFRKEYLSESDKENWGSECHRNHDYLDEDIGKFSSLAEGENYSVNYINTKYVINEQGEVKMR